MAMRYINVIRESDGGSAVSETKVMTELINESFGRVMEVRLGEGGVLSKHKANEPITVLCISGSGVFRAGEGLDESQVLGPGTIIALEAGVEHDVTADDSLGLIVTKFKRSQPSS
jgi:quercetin dioxygenase-like cupin family protein